MPPKVSDLRPSFTVAEGSNVKLKCKLSGIPSPTVTWHKNGIPLKQDFRFSIKSKKQVTRNIILQYHFLFKFLFLITENGLNYELVMCIAEILGNTLAGIWKNQTFDFNNPNELFFWFIFQCKKYSRRRQPNFKCHSEIHWSVFETKKLFYL